MGEEKAAVGLGKEGGGGGGEKANAEEDEPVLLGFWPAFFNSLSMILVTELGDKTFFIAAVLAMRYDRLVIFGGAIGTSHPPTHPPTQLGIPAAHSNRRLLLYPPTMYLTTSSFFFSTHPPTHLSRRLDPHDHPLCCYR